MAHNLPHSSTKPLGDTAEQKQNNISLDPENIATVQCTKMTQLQCNVFAGAE